MKKQSCKTNKDIYIISFSLKFFLKFLSFNIFLFLLNNLFIKIYNIPLKEKIAEFPEVKSALDNGGIGNREIHLKLKPKAHHLGLNEFFILNQIRQGFFGQEVQRLILGRDEVKVWLRYPYNNRNSMGALDMARIKTGNGQEFPLNELAEYEIKRGKVKINHIDGKKEIRVDANLFDAELSGQVNEKINRLLLPSIENLYPEVNYKHDFLYIQHHLLKENSYMYLINYYLLI